VDVICEKGKDHIWGKMNIGTEENEDYISR
jgi:hypothetical protein